MKSALVAHEMPIHKVFSDDYLFTIPSVQRPYSWTTDEAGELLDDMINFINHYEINEKNVGSINNLYFLGSIVLVKNESPNADILDGQQRLTTITILLAVLRDYLNNSYADDIETMIVQKGNKVLNTADTYRLSLRKIDNNFFRKFIQEKGGVKTLNRETPVKTDSQKAIRDNALYFKECLNDLDDEIVKVLPMVIATLCYVVVVSTPDFESAFRIFTVLNDRGLDLMPSDIFKARIIGAINEDEQPEYTEKWEAVELSLGRERFNKLFDHIRMIIQKRKGSVNYKEEYSQIFKTINGKKFIDEYLIPYSDIYLNIILNYRTYYSKQPNMIRILSLLNKIDNNDWIPVAMYYLRHNDDRHEEFLYLLERFAGISMVLRKNFNWRMSKYSQILKSISKGINIFSEDSQLEISEEDKKEVLMKLSGDFYTDLKSTLRKYVLLKLDSLLTNGQPYYDFNTITVEHVLPQNPPDNSEWLSNFKNPEEYVHKLGNLVLLTRSKNSKARNYDFQKKKIKYFQTKDGVSSFALTTQVIQESEWTPEVLKKRQKTLIKLIKNAWKIDVDIENIEVQSNSINQQLLINEEKLIYNKQIKEKYLSTFENEQSRYTIKYLFYKSYSTERLLKRDLYDFSLLEIKNLIKEIKPYNLVVAKTTGSYISSYISWAIENGYSKNTINPIRGIDSSFYEELVDKSKKLHFSFSEFKELLDKLQNAQDQVFLALLWEGLSIEELKNIKENDIKIESNEIIIISNDKFKKVKISRVVMDYIVKALKETHYQLYKEKNLYIRYELLPSDYLFKNIKSKRAKAFEPVSSAVFYSRLNNIKKEFHLDYLTPSTIKQSGMIKMAVDIYLEEGRLEYEQFAKIGDKYGASKMTSGDYEYYNTHLMKEYISPIEIKKLYNIEIQF
jgi:uncharacterized protein with ParB-like and HNH nuclease domain/integrase